MDSKILRVFVSMLMVVFNLSFDNVYSLTVSYNKFKFDHDAPHYLPGDSPTHITAVVIRGESDITLDEGLDSLTIVKEEPFNVVLDTCYAYKDEYNSEWLKYLWKQEHRQSERKKKISFNDDTESGIISLFYFLSINEKGRKVIMFSPPASSPWHRLAGPSMLSAILKKDGHDIVQRDGYIIGLEFLLKAYGGQDIEEALKIIRNPDSDVLALYKARMTLERVSKSIPTKDKFIVERNNVSYVSRDFDGSIEGTLRGIKNRESNIWYDYLYKVEIPFALDYRPDVYGISIADERSIIPGFICASIVKDALPDTLVVLGGNFWARVLSAYNDPGFIKFFAFCDCFVYREGFRPISQLVKTLEPSVTPGTVWKNGDRVVVNPPPKIPSSFEDLPTPEFNSEIRQWSPDVVYPLYTMSNCPMRCEFCAISCGSDTFLDKPRSMSPKRIAEHMLKLGVNRFDITDETFPIKRQLSLGEELKKLGHSATWQCYLNVSNQLLDQDLCYRLYEAGCRGVQLGLESLVPETLNQESKGWNTPKNYGRILQILANIGIQNHVFLLTGVPGEEPYHTLKWLPFLEEYGDSILTIKGGRWRPAKESPETKSGIRQKMVRILDDKPLHLNYSFNYLTTSRKRIEAIRDVLEQACRNHWGYGITSTIPWWINRGRYTLNELKQMALALSKESDVPHLERSITKTKSIIYNELGLDPQLNSFDDVLKFARTI